MRMCEYKLSKVPGLKVLGRTNGCLEPLTLFWTASGIEMNVRAREVWISVEADYRYFEPWIDVVIDGALSQRFMVTKGTHELCVMRCMDASVVRNLRILRDTQPMPDDPDMLLQILSVRTDGQFFPETERKLRLEFIGDSITSGEGGCGAPGEMDWVSGVFSCTNNYTYMTAQQLDADYHVISQSGWGIYCNYQGRTEQALPLYYEQICGVLKGQRNASLGAGEQWDFSQWQPDVVVINLGTNDAGSFERAGVRDPFTGFVNPMRIEADGAYNEQDRLQIEQAAYAFLQKLRRCNPQARLIWCLGMIGSGMNQTVMEAVRRYCTDTGDTHCMFVRLDDTSPEEFGSRAHPGTKAHARAAGQLASVIRADKA